MHTEDSNRCQTCVKATWPEKKMDEPMKSRTCTQKGRQTHTNLDKARFALEQDGKKGTYIKLEKDDLVRETRRGKTQRSLKTISWNRLHDQAEPMKSRTCTQKGRQMHTNLRT